MAGAAAKSISATHRGIAPARHTPGADHFTDCVPLLSIPASKKALSYTMRLSSTALHYMIPTFAPHSFHSGEDAFQESHGAVRALLLAHHDVKRAARAQVLRAFTQEPYTVSLPARMGGLKTMQSKDPLICAKPSLSPTCAGTRFSRALRRASWTARALISAMVTAACGCSAPMITPVRAPAAAQIKHGALQVVRQSAEQRFGAKVQLPF